jgi:hemerythrin-like domain-containing protein
MGSSHLHLDHAAETTAGPATADLRHEHEVILRALAVLERIADRPASREPVSDATLAELVELLQTFADRCHHGKEEEHLFPAMRTKGMGGTLAIFLEEHEEGRGYVRTLASGPAHFTGDELAAAARRYVGLLRDHIQRENEVLFPLADGLFSPEEHAALARAYEDVELHVAGPGIHARLLATLAHLEAEVPSNGRRP